MSDLKIGDRVTGIKGNTRVTGTVMNIKEGHVHIKAPVSGVYAPIVSIVPLHKVTKLGEGAMKRKAEDEDDGGMSDYMHHAQTSSAPFDNAKPAKPHADKFGNRIKIGNVAKNLAKQGMSGVKKEEVEQVDEVNARHSLEAAQAALTPTARRIKDALSKTNRAKSNTNKYARRISKISPEYKPKDVKDHLRSMGEDLNYRRVYEPTSAQALNPGLQKRIDDVSNAQKPAPAGRRPIGKIKLMTRKEEVEQVDEESAHSIVNNLKADGKHEEAGAKAFEHGLGRKYGQHFGLRSTKDKDEASFHRGYDHAEAKSKKVQEGIVSTVKKFIRDYKNYKNPSPQKDYREDPVKAAAARKKFFENDEQNTGVERALSRLAKEDYAYDRTKKVISPTKKPEPVPVSKKGFGQLGPEKRENNKGSSSHMSGMAASERDRYEEPRPKPPGRPTPIPDGLPRPGNRPKPIPPMGALKKIEEGYKGRKAFGSAYDKTHDPFQDSNRAFKSRELERELAHEAPSGPSHHDQTPHDVHIDGKKWKTFGSSGHAHNVANKLSISGKKASVHKTPIAEKAPPGWEGTVKAMKKHSEIDNPYALAWWMKRKGAKSHKDEK